MRNGIWEDLKNIGKPKKPKNHALRWVASSKVAKILIWIWVIGAVWTSVYNSKLKKNEFTDEPYKIEKKESNFKYDEARIEFWDDNDEYFAKWYSPKKEFHIVSDSWKKVKIKIIHDAWLDFYKVTKDDIKTEIIHTWKFKLVPDKAKRKVVKGKSKKDKKTKPIMKKVEIVTVKKVLDFDKIISKISQLDRFKYLGRKEYDRDNPGNKTQSFNIWKQDAVKDNMLLPIPLDSRNREISDAKFAFYCKRAIEDMKSNQKYSVKTKEFIDLAWWEKNLVAIMVAFARSETSEDFRFFTQKIWFNELHRWEERYRSFSFTYYHILMDWPWFKARLKLNLTEWQCYHPQNAWMLFLWYWIEKTNWNLNRYFPLNSPERIRKAWAVFNWSASYAPKFKANLGHSKKILGI
ncbi:MAG: hypothetical protein ACD_3C00054G0009 [uncultured bacterium (gcode 4)]|uniref:Uncharacterized protein n=1 Tax=uncultured bacterium (gcode 4) TaxID=1234023 RepID=K2GDX5_9BACT|nr:MAG: hypothetical protein ACD_3C00054G0009 [uncultured bacterium (gcode 4)]